MDTSEVDTDDDGVDLEDIRQACMVSEVSSQKLAAKNSSNDADFSAGLPTGLAIPSDSEGEDDFEMVHSIKSQLALYMDVSLPPTCLSNEEEDDVFETLRASPVPDLEDAQDGHSVGLHEKTSIESLDHLETCQLSPMPAVTVPDSEDVQDGHSADLHEDDVFETLRASPRRFSADGNSDPEENIINDSPRKKKQVHDSDNEPSSFPEAAHFLLDAIKKNRAYQKLLRRQLERIEATIKQNEKHLKNVKIVKGFQAACKRITKLAVSQSKDPCVELISTRKSVPGDSSEANDKKISPLMLGPPENPCVAAYRMALEKYPLSVERRKWSTEENKNLAKGLKQEVQKILLSEAIEPSSDLEGSTFNIDTINESIENLEITPEMIRQFLQKINWGSLDIKDRSAAECEARWMSSEDPLINHGLWTAEEDKNLARIIQEKSLTNWVGIAVSLGTNRTPFQCLARYQRSLNASILRKEWTAEEDDQLRAAVELFGDKDWQSVANELIGRTGTQCSNRWKKSLCPTRKGRWSVEEVKRLKVAVTLFGSQNWHKITQFVPGRTAAQCRERWVNCSEPKLNRGKWTEEEDQKLNEAIAEHGYSWSKVASHLDCRTDNQCWRRWKILNPHRVALLQEARRFRKDASVRNFVDRESERPAFLTGPILALPEISEEPDQDSVALKKKRKAKVLSDHDS